MRQWIFLFGDFRSFYFHSLLKFTFLVSNGQLCLYDKKKRIHVCLWKWNISSRVQLDISLASYRVQHSKKNSISTPTYALFSIRHINNSVIQGFPSLRKAVTTHENKYDIFSRVFDIANQILTRHSPLASLGQADE